VKVNLGSIINQHLVCEFYRAIPSLLDINFLAGNLKPKKEAMPEPPCQKMHKKRNRKKN
jgi:hypothetical protein